MMAESNDVVTPAETERFTVGVFQNSSWAARALEAFNRHGFPIESLSLVGQDGPELASLIEQTLGAPARRLDVKLLGPLLVRGPIVEVLQGSDQGLVTQGIAATMRRVGFQAHDGVIFETLVSRGGVLVGVRSEPRAADAIALLHAYGGGNAAIGAWTGRV